MENEETASPTVLYPRARRVCRFLRRAIWWSLITALVALVLLVMALVSFLHFEYFPTNAVLMIACWAFAFSLGVLAAASVVWFVTVTLFFVRYSLAHLLGTTVIGAACVTGAISLPLPWNVCSGAGFVVLGTFVFFFIYEQDPEGDALVPAFILEAIRHRRE